jgi:hypothetical protein
MKSGYGVYLGAKQTNIYHKTEKIAFHNMDQPCGKELQLNTPWFMHFSSVHDMLCSTLESPQHCSYTTSRRIA